MRSALFLLLLASAAVTGSLRHQRHRQRHRGVGWAPLFNLSLGNYFCPFCPYCCIWLLRNMRIQQPWTLRCFPIDLNSDPTTPRLISADETPPSDFDLDGDDLGQHRQPRDAEEAGNGKGPTRRFRQSSDSPEGDAQVFDSNYHGLTQRTPSLQRSATRGVSCRSLKRRLRRGR